MPARPASCWPPILDEVTDEDWQRIFAVNVMGPFHCARAVKEPMLAAGGGQIINVTSVAAFAGKGSSIPYAASKAALNNLTIALAPHAGPEDSRQRRGAGLHHRPLAASRASATATKAMKRTVEKMCPLEKVCEPADVAAAIMSLVTGSPMITGQMLVCDGGMLIGK